MQDKQQNSYSLLFAKAQYSSKWYTTTERDRELLSAIETWKHGNMETCKEYKNILLGYHLPIIVFTDHKNNTFNGSKANASDRVLRTCWFLLLEEYVETFEYLPGKKHKMWYLSRMLYPVLTLIF
jgi:hypothetical protein